MSDLRGRGKRAALHNLGCKTNAYETEAMAEILKDDGYTIVDFSEKADVYVINTCTVTNIADRKSRQMLHRAKKMNPEAIVCACGCYVQTADMKNFEDDDSIDVFIGTNEKSRIAEGIDEYIKTGKKVKYIADLSKEKDYENMRVRVSESHARAFVKVQDGCNRFCSYCIIPFARGRLRSARPEDVIEEVSGLAKRGFKEVVLTGIHITSYENDGRTLVDLICEIDKIPGIERIRLGSVEPGWITDDVAKTLSSLKSFCPHFHLSLQSGSKSVLERMNRKYTPDEFALKCDILRKYFFDPALTTDIIVGFPGETDEEFNETLQFAKRIAFYEIHVFKYSMRAGTAAAKMDGQLTDSVKTERSHLLMEEAARLKEEFESRRRSASLEVLIEEYDGTAYKGHSAEYIELTLPAKEGEYELGEIYKVKW
ncbi:MAG: tRNA (N(6)-L-threonylcarbamoyladenosine(37)-C(2))-methylthiotransferase MtaB [Eubacterium sp.]|nr:tRNA (N(6)-L-threonylcarbamoyladenosine(37)-C(2))-methylthiotransferase MtaB [Eubacterium sp.]